jgi:hypothetical protein
MNFHSILTTACMVLLLGALTGTVSADLDQAHSPITGKVFVSSVTFDPEVFFSGDTGVATYTVMNSNTNTSVMLNHGTFQNNAFRLLSETYDFSNTLGPLQSRPFAFTITTDAMDGDYYPTFSLSFSDSNLYHKSLLQVDNTPLDLTVVDKPDAYTQGKKKTVYMQVSNPRNNQVKNVVLKLAGDGAGFAPSQVFVGNLGPGQKVPVNFSVTPGKETPIKLTLNYDNGDNPHTVAMELPVSFGSDKKAANPVMSNVQVKNEAGTWHVTGDVNNAGLETANTVMVTSLSPAVPEDPYKVYVVGALKPDDFGSFEVTFTAENVQTVPIKLSYKDADGNLYDSVQEVKISSSPLTSQKNSSGGLPVVPIAAGIVLLVIFVGGWAYHLRRNKQ